MNEQIPTNAKRGRLPLFGGLGICLLAVLVGASSFREVGAPADDVTARVATHETVYALVPEDPVPEHADLSKIRYRKSELLKVSAPTDVITSYEELKGRESLRAFAPGEPFVRAAVGVLRKARR